MRSGSTARRRLLLVVKVVAALSFMAVLVWKVDWRASLRTLSTISLPGLALLLVVSLALVVVSCLKWQLFLREEQREATLGSLVRLYLVGYFFNNFAPSTVGGDVARGMMLGRATQQHVNAFASVFLERFTGMVALLGLGSVAAIANPKLAGQAGMLPAVLVMLGALAGMVAFLGAPPLQRRLAHWAGDPDARGWRGMLRRFLDAVFWFRQHPRVLAQAMGYSALFHVLTIVNVVVACEALGIDYRPLDLALVVPLVLLVSAVPISLNAIGLMEGSFVWFLGLAAVPAPAALSVALVLRLKNLLLAAIGGLFLVGPSTREGSA